MRHPAELIPYVDLSAQWQDNREELLPIIDSVLSGGQYIGGSEIEKFENTIAKLCKVQYAVALNSGTDALTLALSSVGVGPGDEVITPPNSFIASAAAIVHLGARPVFVDVHPDLNIDTNKIEHAITKKTKVLMPVHLTGRMADMDTIMKIADKYNLAVIEDAAQAIGSLYRNNPSGSFGKIGCFSTHPLKNLNACGDGGFITTNDKDIYKRVSLLRNHGLSDRNTVNHFGYVSRMDTLQAAILNFRLDKLHDIIEKRRQNAQLYFGNLDNERIFIPGERQCEFNTYHTFVIQVKNRDDLKTYLYEAGIETAIHYPIPIHLQPASKQLGYKYGDFPITEEQAGKILTLPIHQYLTAEQIYYTADLINKFFGVR